MRDLCNELEFGEADAMPPLSEANFTVLLNMVRGLTDLTVTIADKKSYGSVTLFKDDLYSVGLLQLRPNGLISDHDHPGSKGLSLMMRGSVNLLQYTGNGGIVGGYQMRLEKESHINTSEVSSFGSHVGNIHTLKAGPEGALMLNVMENPYDDDARNFYLSKQVEGDVVTAKQVSSAFLRKMAAAAAA